MLGTGDSGDSVQSRPSGDSAQYPMELGVCMLFLYFISRQCLLSLPGQWAP